jgi:hypothetical protein
MAARSTVKNRHEMRQAREELRRLPPEQRDDLRYDGVGPGESYVGLWKLINTHRHRVKTIRGWLDADDVKIKKMAHSRRIELEKTERYHMERVEALYGRVLGKEKPQLQSVTLKGDPRNPLHTSISLRGLPKEDLLALARILPKLGGGSSG